MILTDTHTHLYSDSFKDDRDEMVLRALDKGISRMFMPNVDLDSVAGMMELNNKYPDNLFMMLGLHPCSVEENYQEVISNLKIKAKEIKIVAIGEIGLDLYWKKTNFEEQRDAFITQINWAKELKLPIVIHSRDAIEESIKILEESKDENLKGVMHCFGGTLDQAKKITDLGFYLGIGGIATFKNAGLDKILTEIDLNYLVLETDSPYIAPVPHRGKRNESAYLLSIAEHVAFILGKNLEELAKITTLNSKKLFGL